MKQANLRKAQDVDRRVRGIKDCLDSARESKVCSISGFGASLELKEYDPPSEIGRTFVHVQSSVIRLLEAQLRELEKELRELGVELED